MPSRSKAQARFFAAISHSKAFAKRVRAPQKVGREFNRADKGTKLLSAAMRGKRKKH